MILSPSGPPAVKICGLTRREDASFAARTGADYLGVVLVERTPRAVSVSQGKEVAGGHGVPVVGVMANPSLEEAVEGAVGLGASVIQLHGEESTDMIRELREAGAWKIWKAIRVKDPATLFRDLERYSGLVDGFLLDSWHPRVRGGTGATFSWADVATMRDGFPAGPILIAAGGLDPGNVAEAIRRLRPHVVDVSSRVESEPGIKSREKVAAFIRAVTGTGAEKELG